MMEYVGVSDRLKSNGWTVAQESRLVDGNTLILDIVAIRDQRAVIIEPTIVYENTPTSSDEIAFFNVIMICLEPTV
jgi:hypothetical protein